MKPGLPPLALLCWPVLVFAGGNASSLDAAKGSGGERESLDRSGDAKIRTLDEQWVLESCARGEDVPFGEMALVCRSYIGVKFQEAIRTNSRCCDGAHALLLRQKDEASRLGSSPKDLHRKQFYSRYRYAGARGEEAKVRCETLLIPRRIISSASTHRLVAVNILENTDERGVVRDCLQLSYEDVPSQCRCSALFKPLQAETLERQERSYRAPSLCSRSCERCGNTQAADSDGDASIVKLAVAAALAEWIGRGACAQIGRGGYSASHEGMVHAFLLLTPESSRQVRSFMDGNALGTEQTLAPGESREFVQTEHDMPYWHEAFLGLLNLSCFVSADGQKRRAEVRGRTYRAVVSNHRQESQGTPGYRPAPEMMLVPLRAGVMTIGTLNHVYCTTYFGKHVRDTIFSYNPEGLFLGPEIMDSPRHRAMRRSAAFEGIMLDVDAANAEAMRRRRSQGHVRSFHPGQAVEENQWGH